MSGTQARNAQGHGPQLVSRHGGLPDSVVRDDVDEDAAGGATSGLFSDTPRAASIMHQGAGVPVRRTMTDDGCAMHHTTATLSDSRRNAGPV